MATASGALLLLRLVLLAGEPLGGWNAAVDASTTASSLKCMAHVLEDGLSTHALLFIKSALPTSSDLRAASSEDW